MLGSRLDTILGIEIRFLNDHSYSCRSCMLSRNGNLLDVGKGKISEGSLAQVLEGLPRNYPVALVLTGKGVIHKKITALSDRSDVFQQVFPSIEPSDFYSQFYEQESVSIMSIVRKQVVNPLLSSLALAGFQVLMLSLGGILVSHILKQFNTNEKEIIFDGHQFNLLDRDLSVAFINQTDQSNFRKINVAGNEMDERSILSYAAAFQLMMSGNIHPVLVDAESIHEHLDSFIINEAIKKKVIVFITFIFLALLISFLVFAHYNNENAKLAIQVGSITSSDDRNELLKKNTTENQFLLEELKWNGGYSYAYLIDQIGKSMPRRISLIEIAFNNSLTEIEKISKSPILKISGTTDNLIAVNNWIYILKEKNWVKKVNLLRYEEESEGERFHFNLKIEY